MREISKLIVLSGSFWLGLASAGLEERLTLEQVIDSDGRIVVPEGFSGTIDPAGFVMKGDGATGPAFMRASDVVDEQGSWQAFGGVNFGCNGDVRALTATASRQIVLGGSFSACGDVAVSNVALYDPVEDRFSPLGEGIDGGTFPSVNDLVSHGGQVYAGGRFTEAGGQPAFGVAMWDGQQWQALGSGEDQGVKRDGDARFAQVFALAIDESGRLYVGGAFDTAGAESAANIAVWDGEWQALGSGMNSLVGALTVDGAVLFAGGLFTEAGGIPANRIASWDGEDWAALGVEPANGLNSNPSVIRVFDGNVYAGGGFTEAGGQTANRVAVWDGISWSALGDGLNSSVTSIVQLGADLIVGGGFSSAGGDPASRLARWNGEAWSSLTFVGETASENGVNSPVLALTELDGDLYAVGTFDSAGSSGPIGNRIIRWDEDASRFESIGGDGQNGANHRIQAIAVMGGDVYVAGIFSRVGDVGARRIARWDGQQWHPLGTGANRFVEALAVDGNALYAGGRFTFAGVSASRIARWQDGEWHALGAGVNGNVFAIAVADDGVYVGGDFTQAGGQEANRIARWDGSTWHPLTTDEGNGVDATVLSIAAAGPAVYVGGNFGTAGGLVVQRIARWEDETWHALTADGQTGLNSSVTAILVFGQSVYVGGSFVSSGPNALTGMPLNRIARWDGIEWSPLGPPDNQGVNGTVRSIAHDGRCGILVGGDFNLAGDVEAGGVALWDGGQWQALGLGADQGVDGQVSAVRGGPGGRLHVGGAFGSAGGELSSAYAIYRFDQLFRDGFQPASCP